MLHLAGNTLRRCPGQAYGADWVINTLQLRIPLEERYQGALLARRLGTRTAAT